MSKVIKEQVKRFKDITEKTKRNLNRLQGKGIEEQQLAKIYESLNAIEKENDEIDRLKTETKEKSRVMNRHLMQAKADMKELKKIVKNNIPNICWQDFGVLDKR